MIGVRIVVAADAAPPAGPLLAPEHAVLASARALAVSRAATRIDFIVDNS
jgi:hypothetical protein